MLLWQLLNTRSVMGEFELQNNEFSFKFHTSVESYQCIIENAVNLKNKLITFKLHQIYIYMLHLKKTHQIYI